MVGRDKIIKVAAAVHLAIAALFGIHVPVEAYIPQAIDRPLSIYGGFTGVRARFDFFAPDVWDEARVDFLITFENGLTRRVRLATTTNDEANRRMALMYTIFGYPSERERLMRAWGDYVLRLHPDAVEVQTRVEVSELPTMRESVAERVMSWKEVGRATVRRGGSPGR